MKVAPMIPKEVWYKVEKLIEEMIKCNQDEDNWWCIHSLITREVLRLLEEEKCLKNPKE